MQTHLIYWPMLVVLAIPVFVLLLNGKRKSADRKAGNVHPDAPINNTAWSLPVVLTSNALANQFQLPVMFYVLCLIVANLNAVSMPILIVCWLFSISRWMHVLVHVSSNSIPLRMSSFLFGGVMLLALFLMTILALVNV